MSAPLQRRNGEPIQVKYYPDQTPLVTERLACDTLVLRPTCPVEFFAAMFWCDAQRMRGTPVKHLVLPLVPGSRQDRLNSIGDALFTLRSYADMINAREFETVAILDPHSDVTPALIDNVRVWTVADVASDFFKHAPERKYDAIIAPDAGAAKRAELFASILDIPVIQATKQRSLVHGTITDYHVPSLSVAQRYLIVDDLCDGGSTFRALRNAAVCAPMDLYVTHGLFTRGTVDLVKAFDTIYCTDSVLTSRQHGVTVIPIAQRMADYV